MCRSSQRLETLDRAKPALLVVLWLSSLALPGRAAAATYYVDVDGRGGASSDSNPGTVDRPFKTIEAARDAIRALGTPGHTVYIRGGIYRLTSPLMFDQRDSGAAGQPNTYRSYAGETVVISGGQTLKSTWTQVGGGIWSCNVGALKFNSLWVDGVRATRAREPNTGWYTSLSASDSTQAFGFTAGDINPQWTNLKNVEIQYTRQYAAPRQRIASVDTTSNSVWVQGRVSSTGNRLYAGNRYYVENVLEGLNAPGEWYLNTVNGTLYYYPVDGSNPNTSEIIYPVLGQTPTLYVAHLLNVKGSDSANYAAYLDFQGLTFAHTDWYLPQAGCEGWSGWIERFDPGLSYNRGIGPGIVFSYARNCTLRDCTISHIGGNGVMGLGVDGITISGCEIGDTGAHGCFFGTTNYAPFATVPITGVSIEDSVVHDAGVVFPVGMGIYLGAVGTSSVLHNTVYNTTYIGIHVGRTTQSQALPWQQNNKICYNDVHDTCTALIDSGALFLAGKQNGSLVEYNKVQNIPAWVQTPDGQAGGNGVYIDSSGEGITIRNNWFVRVPTGCFLHDASNNRIENNVFVATTEYSQWGPMFLASNTTISTAGGNVLERNIFHSTAAPTKRILVAWNGANVGASDRNVWHTTTTWRMATTLKSWQTNYGFDLHSLTVDPLFVDEPGDDFNLKANSPALGLGFQQIDLSTVGPQARLCTILASAGTGGSISPSGRVTMTRGGNQTFTFTPNAGYVVADVLVDGASVGAVSSYTFSDVSTDHSIQVSFKAGAYTLITAATNGSVTRSPDKSSYAFNESVSLTAAPQTGYVFAGWSGDLTGTANPATLVMNGNKTVTAAFTASTYTLAISATNGAVTATPNKTSYTYGETVTLQAVPNAGYSFSGWSGGVTGTANPTTLIMDGNKTVSAAFTANTYTLTVGATNGAVTRTPSKTSYVYGETVTLQAVPNAGYSFTGWSGALTGATNPATVVMNGNKSVTAGFTASEYTLTISATNGAVTKTPSKMSYPHGETVTLQAVPNAGYSFTGWSGALTGTINPTTLVMDGNKSVTAGFTVNTYTLTISATNGTVTRTPSKTSYVHGEKVTLQAVPNTGYSFSGWSGGVLGTANPTTLVMDGNKTVSATFTANAYTLTISATNGTVTATPSKTGYAQGEVVTLQAVPSTGYIFSGWSGDLTGATSPAPLTMTSNKTVMATFSPDDRTAPAVVQCAPAPEAIQVPLSNLVTLHIIDDGAGVDANSVVIRVAGNVVYQGNVDTYPSSSGQCSRSGTKQDYQFIYQSKESFDFDQVIAVSINGRDLARNAMNEYTYSFTTQMRVFGTNVLVSTSGGNADGNAATACDPAGNTWVAWHDGPVNRRNIYVAKRPAGSSTFGTPMRLTSGSRDECNPVLAVGADGAIYVAWQDNRSGNWDIYLAVSWHGTTFSSGRRVAASNRNQINPALAVDHRSPNGVYVAWEDDRNGNWDIYVAKSTNAFASSTMTRITDNKADQKEPAVGVDAGNLPYVFWTDLRNGPADLYGASAGSATRAWANVPVVIGPADQSQPAVAAGAGTALHLVWVDNRSGDNDIYYAALSGLPSSPIAGVSLIDDTSDADQIAPGIAYAANGKVFVCWQDSRGMSATQKDTDLYVVEVRSGVPGANIFVGDDGSNSNQSDPSIGVDASDQPYVAWTDSRATTTEIYCAGTTQVSPTALDTQLVATSAGATLGTAPAALRTPGEVSVVVPPASYPVDLRLSVSSIVNPRIAEEALLGGYEFGPSGAELDRAVTVTIPYAALPSGHQVLVYGYDAATGALSQRGLTEVRSIYLSSGRRALQFQTTRLMPYYIVEADSSGAPLAGNNGPTPAPTDNSGPADEVLLP